MNALVGELDFPNLCMCSRTYLWHVTCMYRAIKAISVKWYFWRTLSKCNLFLPVIKNCNVKKNSLEAKCCLKVDDIMYVLVLILITPVFAIISYEPPHCLYRWYAPQVSSSPLLSFPLLSFFGSVGLWWPTSVKLMQCICIIIDHVYLWK